MATHLDAGNTRQVDSTKCSEGNPRHEVVMETTGNNLSNRVNQQGTKVTLSKDKVPSLSTTGKVCGLLKPKIVRYSLPPSERMPSLKSQKARDR